MSNDLVVKSNSVVEASYKLSACEQRLVLCAIAQTPKGSAEGITQPVTDDAIYWVSVSDFIALGVHPKTAYRDLRAAAKKLYERSVILSNGEVDGKPRETRWIQEKCEERGSQAVGVRFTKSMLPYLSNLTENFTQYLKNDIAGVSSSYTVRFYEFMCQYRTAGRREIPISDLRRMLELGEKYPKVADLKKRVIDVAIKEVNERSPLKASYTMGKTGREYTSIILTYKEKRPSKKNRLENLNGEIDAAKKGCPSWQKKGLSDGQIRKLGVHKKDFIDANSSVEMLTAGGASSQSDYNQIWESWKPLLANPESVGRFKMIQEILQRPVIR